MELRPYQEEAVEAVRDAWAEGVRDPAVEIFCGLGKSLIMKTLLQELDGIRLVVMPSLSLVNQFCHDYLDMDSYLPFCSLGECDEVMRATTQEEQVAAFLEGEPDGILVVTYKSLAKLLGFLEGREIEGTLFDESHHIDERQYNFIKELQILPKVAYFSATPPKNLGQTVFEFSYADALNYVDSETGESRPWSRDFRVLTAMYTDLPGDSMVETLARAIQESGNGRVLTFHAQVNGESENSVKNFHKRCKALQGLFPDRKVTTRWMDADTSMADRARFLRELDETPDHEVYVIHSCETISEGVDTKCCNHVFFCDAAMSYRIAIQKIGRCVRLREQRHPATVTIPACIPRDEYAALGTVEERNAYIREQYSALGKFSQLFDFTACLRENDQELLDLVLQAHKAPGRKEHYERELEEEGEKKEKPRFTLEQAVQRITGNPFSGDLAADADTAGRTVEVHSLENGVETYGSGAALETLVEMEPGQYVHSRRRVPPPKGNRLHFTESPFLLSLHATDGVDIGDGIGGSLRTAVMDYEVRPERTDMIIQMLRDFYNEYGEPPKTGGTHDHEKTLATWISNRRQDKKKHRKLTLCARIETEFQWWSWTPLSEKVEETIQMLHTFYAEHGLPKKDGRREKERFLSAWISTRRREKKSGKNATFCDRIEREFHWWSWDPHSDRFNTNFQELHDFYALYGEPKQRGVNKNEHHLAMWINTRKMEKMKGLNLDVCARIDREFSWWKWDKKSDVTDKIIQRLHTFYKVHGVPKHDSACKNERALNSWIVRRRRDKRNDLNADLCSRIETEFDWWTWDPITEMHDNNFQLLHKFYAQFGEPKQNGLHLNEKVLAAWITSRRQDKKNGLSSDLCARVDREFAWWRWDPITEIHGTNIQLMHSFYSEYGVPKKGGIRPNEKNLSHWINRCRTQKKKQRNLDLCERIEREFPWWSWDPFADGLESTIRLMHAFYAEHGDEPKCNGQRKNEKKLGKWINHVRCNKRNGQKVELCERIDREFIWWKWSGLNAEIVAVVEYESMTIPKLKDMLRERGLAAGGRTKASIIDRLRHYDGDSKLLPELSVQADQVAASGMTKFNIPMIFQH